MPRGRDKLTGSWSTHSKFSKPVNMPDVGSYVKQQLYELEISVPALAKRLSISADRAYRLLRRKEWKVSEMMNLSLILDINLFAWYAGQTGAVEETAPLHHRIAELEEKIKTMRIQMEVLEKVAGVKS
jgi:hypothetical protein